MGVQWAAELLREALQVQQRALPECRHVWRCLCLEGVPQQNSGSFHDASFQREPRPYVTAACLRHNCAASVQLKAMARDSRLSSALRDASRALLEWFIVKAASQRCADRTTAPDLPTGAHLARSPPP